MPTITANDIVDLMQSRLPKFDMNFVDLAATLQQYEAMDYWFAKGKIKQQKGGSGVRWHPLSAGNGSARMTGLYDEDVVNVPDITKKCEVSWRSATYNFAVDVDEINECSGEHEIYDLMKTRSAAAQIAYAELIEDQLWSKPATSSDNLNLLGIPSWLVPNATEGFNGGNPSGFSSGIAGLSTADAPYWANYTATYTNFSRTDVLTVLRRAMMKTKWRSPIEGVPLSSESREYRGYTSFDTYLQLQTLMDSANDNLGNDIEGKQVTFNRNKLMYLPKMDAVETAQSLTDPIYLLHMPSWEVRVLAGAELRKTTKASPRQRNVVERHWDMRCLIRCIDRRRNAVIYRAA